MTLAAAHPSNYEPVQQEQPWEIQVVQCRYCGKIQPIEDVKFRCPKCRVFLDGPIFIAHYEAGEFTFYETGETYSYKYEKVQDTITAWDVLNQGPISLLKQNRNWLSIVCGSTGTGKSWTTIRICEMLSPKFNADQIAFDIPNLLDLFESCRAGEFIIFDEGNEWNAREAQKRQNVIFSKILAMLRFTQINVVFTLPHLGMIDINGRRLAHNYLYAIPINRETCPTWQRSMSGVYWYNILSTRLPRSGQTDIPLLYKFPIIRGERVSKVWFTKASDTLIEEYESRKAKVWGKKLVEARKLTRAIDDLGDTKQIERVEKLKERALKAKETGQKQKPSNNLLNEILGSAG